MNKAASTLLARVLVPSLLVFSLSAAESKGNPASSDVGTPATEGNTKTDIVPAGDAANPTAPEKPDRAIRPAGNTPTAEIQQMLEDFREQQRARLEEYRRLAVQSRYATAERRQQLREQLRQMLADQKAERERLREQIQERMQELKLSLPSRKDVIDAAKEKAREKQSRSRGE